MPTIEVMQVQYLVAFCVGLCGEFIQALGKAFADFGVTVCTYSGDGNAMAALTTGIFGTESGLIYWINGKLFWCIEHFPWSDMGQGLGQFMNGLLNPPPC